MAGGEWEQLELSLVDQTDPHVVAPPDVRALLLTIVEAGRMLGVGRSTIYELIAAGELEVVHIGRSARVPVGSVHDYVQRLRARAKSA